MGKILVIEDDRNIQGLIEKIFPKEKLKVIKTAPPGRGPPEMRLFPFCRALRPRPLRRRSGLFFGRR